MTVPARNNEWSGLKERHNTEAFKDHVERMDAFRQSHTDDRDIDVVEQESFEEHDERMKEFRRSHANVALVNGVRLDEAALLERTEPLAVRRNMMEAEDHDLSMAQWTGRLSFP